MLRHRSRVAHLVRYQYVPVLGAAALLVTGALTVAEAGRAVVTALPALSVIASVMVITACIGRLGLVDGVAMALLRLARGSGRRLYALFFGLSAEELQFLLTPDQNRAEHRAHRRILDEGARWRERGWYSRWTANSRHSCGIAAALITSSYR